MEGLGPVKPLVYLLSLDRILRVPVIIVQVLFVVTKEVPTDVPRLCYVTPPSSSKGT